MFSDVLAAAGFNEETNPAVHCIFEGIKIQIFCTRKRIIESNGIKSAI